MARFMIVSCEFRIDRGKRPRVVSSQADTKNRALRRADGRAGAHAGLQAGPPPPLAPIKKTW
jgi:hypothetical protein